ncbi:MAG: ankyrin repeat domain-containing protein [Armatimonadetes bacterium]|nr:ankyrin repeat domain-containing protein [Armatimonadota bacterium]
MRPTQQLMDEFVVASHGDLDKVKALLAGQPVLIQARARWDESALEAAAHTGQREIAEYLLSKGAVLDICTAAMLGMTDRVREFLQADPGLAHGAGAHGIPVLFFPVIAGHREVAELLRTSGADVNAGAGAMTPLHGAAVFGQAEMAAWLLTQGADVNARDFRGQTPVRTAIQNGHGEVADLLRRRGGTE